MKKKIVEILLKQRFNPFQLSVADICIVYTYANFSGWILDAIADYVFLHMKRSSVVVKCRADDTFVPRSKKYFFLHPVLYFDFIKKIPGVRQCNSVVFYTHAQREVLTNEEVSLLNRCSGIISMSSLTTDFLVKNGVNERLISMQVLGCDEPFRTVNLTSKRDGVCLSSQFNQRKNPNLLLEIVRSMPDIRFRLAGKNWDDWSQFPELLSLSNFEYCDIPHSDYPKWYAEHQVFLSLSTLEGGPMPLLEALNCGCLPVVSDTGFARDVLPTDLMKLVFPVQADSQQVIPLIRIALQLTYDTREVVSRFTWDRFCGGVEKIIYRSGDA